MQDDGALPVRAVRCALARAILDTGAARALRVRHRISVQLGITDRPQGRRRRHAPVCAMQDDGALQVKLVRCALAHATLDTGAALARRVQRRILAPREPIDQVSAQRRPAIAWLALLQHRATGAKRARRHRRLLSATLGISARAAARVRFNASRLQRAP
jgi:hypothetical protein